MQKNIIFAILGLLIGSVATWGVFQTTGVTAPAQPVANRMSSDTIDAHFIEQMIPHHEDAITMAKVALAKAKRPEVKELADNIVNAQEHENTLMKQWYKEWFGRELPSGNDVMQNHGMMSNDTGLHMGKTGTAMDMESLENAQDFDKAFVQEMIPHHQMAVMMASMLKSGTQREEMKKLADDVIISQSAEIDRMRAWLVEWK